MTSAQLDMLGRTLGLDVHACARAIRAHGKQLLAMGEPVVCVGDVYRVMLSVEEDF